LGPGGWTTINDAHLALIEAALDRHHGRRVLLIFGASHKHRFIDRLRQRPNLVLRQAFTRTNRSDQR
ncbi:MAG: hypothetical protein KDB53_21300, partial [Planctomycetes bacterium]|nr:hypothetical protein [Planctomycetota bacterium]